MPGHSLGTEVSGRTSEAMHMVPAVGRHCLLVYRESLDVNQWELIGILTQAGDRFKSWLGHLACYSVHMNK